MFFPEACLFDLDGLLLDTEVLHGQAWSETAKKFGLTLTKQQLLSLRGRRRIDCADQINKWLIDPVGNESLLTTHKPISKELLRQAKAMPGAEELVRFCINHKIKTALVSSSSEDSVISKSEPHPWLALINTRVLGNDPMLKAGKPSPDPYLLAAQKLNVKAQCCWAMEDSVAGTKSALEAGCQVWVLEAKETLQEINNKSSLQNPIFVSNLSTVLNALNDSLI